MDRFYQRGKNCDHISHLISFFFVAQYAFDRKREGERKRNKHLFCISGILSDGI